MSTPRLILCVTAFTCGCAYEGPADPCERNSESCGLLATDLYVDIASAAFQRAVVGNQVAEPPAARIATPGAGIAGCVATFTVTQGGGLLFANPPTGGAPSMTAISDFNGVARVGGWQLGPNTGANQVEVTSVTCTSILSPNLIFRTRTFGATGTSVAQASLAS
jgi:hypothetical protein